MRAPAGRAPPSYLPLSMPKASGEVGQQAALLANRHFRQTHFEAAVEQVVRVLDRHCARPATAFGQLQEFHGAPRGFVGQADMADLADLDLLVEHFQGFFQRRELNVLVLVVELAEEVGRALGPVQLVQVDPVGLQALEAGIQGGDDVLAIEFQLAVADMADAVAGAGDLAGQNPVSAVAALLEIAADDLLGLAVGFGARRHRVHLGGIYEVDAAGLGSFDLSMAFALAVLLAPGHGAQAQCADIEIGSAPACGIPWSTPLAKESYKQVEIFSQSG